MAILAVRKIQIYTLKIPGNGVLTGLDFKFFWTPSSPSSDFVPPPSQKSYLPP
jgi:hypothetical protein